MAMAMAVPLTRLLKFRRMSEPVCSHKFDEILEKRSIAEGLNIGANMYDFGVLRVRPTARTEPGLVALVALVAMVAMA